MSRVVVYHSFDALPAAYVELFNNASDASSNFFLHYSWFQLLHQTATAANSSLRIYGIESADGKPLMALPMHCNTTRGTLFAAHQMQAFANFYTSLFGPIASQAAWSCDDALNLLAATIAHESPSLDSVTLSPLDAHSPLFDKLTNAFRASGMAVQRYFCFGNWYLTLNGRSYQQYFDSLPSRLRGTITRKAGQLERAGRLRIEIVSAERDIDEGLRAYEAVHQASWKEKEPFPGFIPGLIALCARQNWLRLGVAYVDNRPAAAQIWIVHRGVASIYKLAYDEQLSKLSVGSILTARMMKHAIDVDKVTEVDYLTGDEPYKQDWMSHRRERWGMIAFNLRTVRGVLSAIRHVGGRAVKDFARNKVAHANVTHRNPT